MTVTHLGNAANSLGGAEGIDAGGGNGNGSKGKRGEFHGCVFVLFSNTLFLFVTTMIISSSLGSQIVVKTDSL